ncbi:MAG: adenosylcobinamide amidohydrolase [Deltaproteobacteria bacterium]|nr:adenosylcobinamide amidohydrolase [Deltaproteobacteria bacterium]
MANKPSIALGSAVQHRPASPPWECWIEHRSLIIQLPQSWRVLSWAPLGGGSRRARVIINHQVQNGDRAATEHPERYLKALMGILGFKAASAIAMMTGVPIRKVSRVTVRRGDMIVAAWCTAGCSNALRIGDTATASKIRTGTINIVLAVNQALSPAAMAEALAMATEARVAAMQNASVASIRTQRPATGTGTDCIAVTSPLRGRAHIYCGKHTLLGELIGRAVIRSCTSALRRWSP